MPNSQVCLLSARNSASVYLAPCIFCVVLFWGEGAQQEESPTAGMQTRICTPMLTAATPTTATTGERPNYPLKDEQTRDMRRHTRSITQPRKGTCNM